MTISEEIIARIRERGIEAVGFKLWSGDGTEGAVHIARHIRRQIPSVRIFGGGPQVDTFMERMFSCCEDFDALVYGEGEETIQELAERGGDSRAFDTIPNLLFKRNGCFHQTHAKIITNLDELPLPVYDSEIYPSMRGDEKIRIIVVDDSRGCRTTTAHSAFTP